MYMYISECIDTSIQTYMYLHTLMFSHTVLMFMFLCTVSHAQISAYTPTPTQFSVHFLAPALHDDFSRCLSPGLQPQDWGGSSGWRLAIPFQEGAGPGEVEPSSLEQLPEVMVEPLSSSLWSYSGECRKLKGFIEVGSGPLEASLGLTDWVR